jgi:hypothetical protein
MAADRAVLEQERQRAGQAFEDNMEAAAHAFRYREPVIVQVPQADPEPAAPAPTRTMNCLTSRLGGGMSTTTCRWHLGAPILEGGCFEDDRALPGAATDGDLRRPVRLNCLKGQLKGHFSYFEGLLPRAKLMTASSAFDDAAAHRHPVSARELLAAGGAANQRLSTIFRVISHK